LAIWRPRLVFWLGALAIGVISVGFAELADLAQRLFRAVSNAHPWLILLTPVGFLVSAFLAARFFPNSQGSGIPQAIAARHLREDADRTFLLSLKVAAGKIALTVFGLLFGASIGREGPTVQVGASIMLAVARFGGIAHARGLILAGSAAGIAAAFNTPLAGIVFAIEEMSRTYESRANGLVLAAVIISGLAALGLSGSYDYFGSTAVLPLTARDWVLVPLCGFLGGSLGAAFSGGALRYGQRIRQWVHHEPMKRTLMLAVICGAGVAAVGFISGGLTFGTSYEQARMAIGGTHLPVFFFLEKFIATFLSMLSGIPGGIFAPSLSIGAGLGSTVAQMIGASAGLAAILGMAGYFSGAVQAPMTAFVIIIEMTGDHRAVIPIMATSLIGYVTSRILSREPLYHGLSRVFIAAVLRRNRAVKAHSS
jgi:H+/Cl- antiporter ClcA